MKINNIDKDHERYVVSRLVDGELWYWGSWADRNVAERVACVLGNGIVVDMEGEE